MSADLLRRAAAKLRDPLLCNFDRTLALALADWLDQTQDQIDRDHLPIWRSYSGMDTDEAVLEHMSKSWVFGGAVSVARAVLREDGEQR